MCMISIKDIIYRVICISPDGEQIDITSITTNLGWEEGEKELSVRISLKVYNTLYNGKRISQLIQPGTPIFVYATIGAEQKEMVRGTVEKWAPTYTNGGLRLLRRWCDDQNDDNADPRQMGRSL